MVCIYVLVLSCRWAFVFVVCIVGVSMMISLSEIYSWMKMCICSSCCVGLIFVISL